MQQATYYSNNCVNRKLNYFNSLRGNIIRTNICNARELRCVRWKSVHGTQYTTQMINGKRSFVVTICFTTYQNPPPDTNPKFPLTSAQLVGFNNESFQRPFLIYVPINVEIPTGTHYYTNDRDYEGKVWLNVDTIVTSATMFTNGPTDTIIFH